MGSKKVWCWRNFFIALTVLAYLAGLIWRFEFIFVHHPLSNYLYSDMQSYSNEAQRFFSGSQLNASDTLYPPGTSLIFGLVQHLTNGGWVGVEILMFALSASVPLLIAACAYKLYGLSVGLLAGSFASLYPSFIVFSGFLLSEIPYIFFQALAFLLLLMALGAATRRQALWWGLACGLVLGWTAMIRPTILLATLLLAVVIVSLRSIKKHAFVWPIVLAVFVGAIPFIIGTSAWCSRLSGQFCTISSNGPLNILQGHYDHVGHFNFNDTKNGGVYSFGSPATLQLGYNDSVTLPWGPYDNRDNLNLAKTWSFSHPAQALTMSFEHIVGLFVTTPWPPSNTTDRHLIRISEWLFRIVVLLPVGAYIIWRFIQRLYRKIKISAKDWLLLAPILGLFLLTLITYGDPRYRLSFDMFFIILAARVYESVLKWLKTEHA